MALEQKIEVVILYAAIEVYKETTTNRKASLIGVITIIISMAINIKIIIPFTPLIYKINVLRTFKEMINFLFLVTFIYIFFSGSLHSLFLLLVVEFLVLFVVLIILHSSIVWVFRVIFLFFRVCMSSYGVSLIICSLREKSSFYVIRIRIV